jgi:ribosomal protein L32E
MADNIKKRTNPKFRRTDGHNYSKLGVRRKNKQIYRKSKGRDNKIRLHMKGHVRKVKIGFKNAKTGQDLIKGKKVVMILNVNDLKKIEEGMIGIVGSIGTRKKKEVAEQVIKDKIKLINLDAEKFLKDLEEKMKKKKEQKDSRAGKKVAKDKKAKEKEKEEKKKEEEAKKEAKVEGEKLEDKIGEKTEDKSEKMETKKEEKIDTKDKPKIKGEEK